MEKLKPCPFCGGEARWIQTGFGVAQAIKCEQCKMLFPIPWSEAGTGRDLSNFWSRRTPDTVKHGHYIINDDGDSRCSVCRETYLDCTQNYCPNCGARMDEPEERT